METVAWKRYHVRRELELQKPHQDAVTSSCTSDCRVLVMFWLLANYCLAPPTHTSNALCGE